MSLLYELLLASLWLLTKLSSADLSCGCSSSDLLGVPDQVFLLSAEKIIIIIRIYHECEGGIKQSVRKITVWHHEACRVMTDGDPEGRIFLILFLAHHSISLYY